MRKRSIKVAQVRYKTGTHTCIYTYINTYIEKQTDRRTNRKSDAITENSMK